MKKNMKKLLALLLIAIFLSSNISFAQNNGATPPQTCEGYNDTRKDSSENAACPTGQIKDSFKVGEERKRCCRPIDQWGTWIMGIDCTPDMLLLWQCKLNVYDTLGIRKTVRNEGDPTSVGLFVQDVILSATFFIGTVVTIALIVSWLMYIFAASSGKDPANARKGIVGALIGLLLVVSSYVIIRLVQYIAKGF